MREVITIQIIRPDLDSLDKAKEKEVIDLLAKDIAKQIVAQENLRKINETIAYWQKKLLYWEIEDNLRSTYEKPK